MSSNDYVTIRIPETGWGVSWLRENPDVYCILLYDSNTGAALHHPVLRDLISQVDQYLTASCRPAWTRPLHQQEGRF